MHNQWTIELRYDSDSFMLLVSSFNSTFLYSVKNFFQYCRSVEMNFTRSNSRALSARKIIEVYSFLFGGFNVFQMGGFEFNNCFPRSPCAIKYSPIHIYSSPIQNDIQLLCNSDVSFFISFSLFLYFSFF